jgi:hypothetical protein
MVYQIHAILAGADGHSGSARMTVTSYFRAANRRCAASGGVSQAAHHRRAALPVYPKEFR